MTTVQDQQLFKTNRLTRVLPQTCHLCGHPVLEEVPLDNKEELRTYGPSFPVDLQEALRNSMCPRTTLECALLGIIDYTTHVTTAAMTVHCQAADFEDDLRLMIVDLGRPQVILGMPWLTKHNPHIDWEKKTVTLDAEHIRKTTLSMELAIAAHKDKVTLPLQYSAYADVFSEQTFLTPFPHDETSTMPLTSKSPSHPRSPNCTH